MVKIRVYGKIKELLDNKSSMCIDIGEKKIKLRKLIAKLPCKKDSLKRNVAIILINGKNCIFSGGMDAEVEDNDVVDILPPVAGG